MAFNVQTAGDEAIYCKFPGATGKPTPTSGRSIDLPDGFKELRYIKDASGKVIWAHKWRMTATAGTGGSVSCSPSDRVKNGKEIVVTATPTGSYKFSAWSDGNTTNPRTFTMTDHKSIKALFGSNTYTITFKNYNASTGAAGNTIKTSEMNYGDTPSCTAPTSPDNAVSGKTYTFTGWSPSISKVTGNQTYVAQFSEGSSTVTVTFKDYDGTQLGQQTVAYGTSASSVTKPSDPSRTGYKFTGWGDPSPASAVNASGQVIANCVYYAQYTEQTGYTVNIAYLSDEAIKITRDQAGTDVIFEYNPVQGYCQGKNAYKYKAFSVDSAEFTVWIWYGGVNTEMNVSTHTYFTSHSISSDSTGRYGVIRKKIKCTILKKETTSTAHAQGCDSYIHLSPRAYNGKKYPWSLYSLTEYASSSAAQSALSGMSPSGFTKYSSAALTKAQLEGTVQASGTNQLTTGPLTSNSSTKYGIYWSTYIPGM